ncbi:hypothetical protein PHYBOEH_002230 [Phytophthora boehmeriae]|uniref:Uncharacterized protein n=1 Tax=Phytophthora boehmeriae TaxID=109152 RepID=A0A8T1WUT3_9STRA|nr:hypothetical protein PHYBOEH_002230 [Phytophthora boehmeriae]
MAATTTELRAEDVRQLWSLARLLSRQQLTTQIAQCLEPLCAIDCSSRSAEEQEILLQAHILLAEICTVACSNSRKADDRDLWQRRVIQAEKCVYAADGATNRGVPCNQEFKLRLLKAKFLLQQQLKAERAVKNKRLLEILCEALKCCGESADGEDAEFVAEFRKYFGVKLKACLVKMHAATVMARYAQDNTGTNSFADNITFLRTALPNYVDKSFLLWLVEVSCHSAISSFQPGNTGDMRQLVLFGQDFFDKVASDQTVSPDFHVYHLIITGFYYLRTGKLTKVAPLLENINTLVHGAEGGGDRKPAARFKEAYMKTIVDSLRLCVVASSDPAQALTLAMEITHAAQAGLQTYTGHQAVRLMLLATLFDALHLYCRLLGLQCRYSDMGASIAQMITLFVSYKSELERTIFYRFFLARCHTSIAKYTAAIGKVKDACAHLNYVVDKLLPHPSAEGSSCPDAYLPVWVEVLEAATYCCGVATALPLSTESSNSNGNESVEIKQIYPSRVLLDWAVRVLTMDGLRHHFNHCCSAELRTKYDLALAKWLWATEGLSSAAVVPNQHFTQHAALEEIRPKLFTLLHESLQRNASTNCCETTSEIMALFGPQLIRFGKVEHGEETLTNGLRMSLHSKNVLLQTRVLASIFEVYSSKGLVQAQANIAAKYEKKLAVLRRRIAAAQNEQSTTAVLLRWTAGSNKTSNSKEERAKTSTPLRG